LKDINQAGNQRSWPGADPQVDKGGIDVDGTLYFSAYSGSGKGDDLWKTDGMSAGTTLVAAGVTYLMSDPFGNYDTVDPTPLYNVAGHVVFQSSDNAPGGADELWTSDGTAGGTGPLAPVAASGQLLQAGNTWYFFSGSAANTSLWTTDGTASGTHQILPGGGPANYYQSTVVNGKLFFLTFDPTSGDVELWTSDGTSSGTAVVKDLGTFTSSSASLILQSTGNRLFISTHRFTSASSSASPVWISDGTTAGTVLLASSLDTTQIGTQQSDFVPVNGGFVFGVFGGANNDEQLWFTDGTAAGTKKLADVGTNSFPNYDFSSLGNLVIFLGSQSSGSDTLWATDGTASGTRPLVLCHSLILG
jgi:trimeric autotransporter adhesin